VHALRYANWARALKQAINARLWLEEAGMYSSLTAAHFDGAPMHKFDWLGQALAIVTGVADSARTRSILAHYPHGPMGPPVIFPQQSGMPVYHNRAMWPFVTAYGLKAAAIGGNARVADAAYESLMRGAALNLSNMENLEWLSGQPLLLDEKNPALIGPVINSRRQLWSVGAYLGMVIGNVFGVSTSEAGLSIAPFITARLRRETFAGADSLQLNGLRLRGGNAGGKSITVRIALPPASPLSGYYAVQSVSIDGKLAAQPIAWRAIGTNSTIDVRLGALAGGGQQIRLVGADPYQEDESVFAPPEPAGPDAEGAPGVETARYRRGACASRDAMYTSSGNRSHRSKPACSGEAIEVDHLGVPATQASGAPRKDWGAPEDVLDIAGIDVRRPGRYQVQLRYSNKANQINLGISAGVKWLSLLDASGKAVVQGVVQLPHTRAGQASAYSTPLAARLKPGRYALRLSDFYNMSYLQSNSTFSAAGGAGGPSNKFDLYGVRLLRTD